MLVYSARCKTIKATVRNTCFSLRAQKQGLLQILEVHYILLRMLGRRVAFKKPKKRRQALPIKGGVQKERITL